jgi:hypothetical protein
VGSFTTWSGRSPIWHFARCAKSMTTQI